jgi:hypothetical protein
VSGRVEVTVVAGPRGDARAPLRRRVLAGAPDGEAAALCTDDEAWGLGCACCELRGPLLAALGRLVADRRLRRLLVDVADATALADVLAVVQSPALAQVLEFVGLVGLVHAGARPEDLADRPLARLRRAAVVLLAGDAALLARVRAGCPEPRVLPVAADGEVAARVLAGGGPGRGVAVVRDGPVALADLRAWLDALPTGVARVDGDALVAEWPGRRAVVRKLGAVARGASAPRDGLAGTRLWAVAGDDLALGAP